MIKFIIFVKHKCTELMTHKSYSTLYLWSVEPTVHRSAGILLLKFNLSVSVLSKLSAHITIHKVSNSNSNSRKHNFRISQTCLSAYFINIAIPTSERWSLLAPFPGQISKKQ